MSSRIARCFCGFESSSSSDMWYQYHAQDHADLNYHVVEIFDGLDVIDVKVPSIPLVMKEKVRCFNCGHKKRSHRNTSEWNPVNPCMHVEEGSSVRCECRSWNPVELVGGDS